MNHFSHLFVAKLYGCLKRQINENDGPLGDSLIVDRVEQIFKPRNNYL